MMLFRSERGLLGDDAVIAKPHVLGVHIAHTCARVICREGTFRNEIFKVLIGVEERLRNVEIAISGKRAAAVKVNVAQIEMRKTGGLVHILRSRIAPVAVFHIIYGIILIHIAPAVIIVGLRLENPVAQGILQSEGGISEIHVRVRPSSHHFHLVIVHRDKRVAVFLPREAERLADIIPIAVLLGNPFGDIAITALLLFKSHRFIHVPNVTLLHFVS